MQALRERRPHRPTHTPAAASSLPNHAHSPTSKLQLTSSSLRTTLSPSSVCIVLQALLNVALVLVLLNSHVSTSRAHRKHPPASTANHPLLPPASQTFDFFVTIYAYDRPAHLLNLLRDIAREADAARLRVGVNVIDDNSYGCQFPPVARNIFSPQSTPSSDASNHTDLLVRVPLPSSLPCAASYRFAHVERFIQARNWSLFVSKYRHSRRRYYHLVRHAHHLLRGVHAGLYLFLPDDDRLARNFFPAVANAWHAIADLRKLTLMLHVEASREHVAVWTDLKPRVVTPHLTRIGWVESGNFVADVHFLQLLDWSFPHIPVRRWLDNPPISSGVGATLSALIHEANRHMYRTHRSFVAHVGVTLSQMNAQFRTPNSPALLTKYFADGDEAYGTLLSEAATVTVSIASHWMREVSLHSAVYSLAPQVDRLNVYLNDFDSVPTFLCAPFITVVSSGDVGAAGDMGDVGKFFWANNITTEFHITADDDIIYPPDYVNRLLAFRRTLRPPVVVGVHGIRLIHNVLQPPDGRRGKGYYASREVWMATEGVPHAVNVHIVGTGTMLYKVSEVGHIALGSIFPKPNMADVWFGLLAQSLRLPMMVIPHEGGWIREVPGTFEDSIYKRATRTRVSDRAQTHAALSIGRWHLNNAQSVV